MIMIKNIMIATKYYDHDKNMIMIKSIMMITIIIMKKFYDDDDHYYDFVKSYKNITKSLKHLFIPR